VRHAWHTAPAEAADRRSAAVSDKKPTGATATRRTCGAPAQAAARRVAAVSDKDLKRISANEIRFRQ